MNSNPAKVVFCYDIVCPYAYLASRRIEALLREQAPNASIEWTPVLLGGLYKLDAAPQGKDGSASAVMHASKKVASHRDLVRQAARFNVTLNFNPRHPVRSLNAMRLLTATPVDKRVALTHALYESYWVKNEDVSDASVLEKYARACGVDPSLGSSAEARDLLERQTQLASERSRRLRCTGLLRLSTGLDECDRGFRSSLLLRTRSVAVRDARSRRQPVEATRSHLHPAHPTITARQGEVLLRLLIAVVIPRIHTGEADRGDRGCHLHARARRRHLQKVTTRRQAGETSPYATWSTLHALILCELFLRPLFFSLPLSVGGPDVPMMTFTPRKRAATQLDLLRWCDWINEPLDWPTFFPIRSVTPLRVVITEPKTIDVIFRAAWQQQKNIGDEEVLAEILSAAGFDAASLLQQAKGESAKATLKNHNDTAVASGVFGVPTFLIGDEVVWGQDRLDVVLDLCSGWKPPSIPSDAALSKL